MAKLSIVVVLVCLVVAGTTALLADSPQATLQRGLYLSDLYNWTAARPYLVQAQQLFEASGDERNALYAQLAAIRAGVEPIPLPARSYKLTQELATNPILQSDLELRMYCLAVKGEIDGESVPAYRKEPGVSPTSTTATYAAMRVLVDNWRWTGVPFYLRSGKRLKRARQEVSIHFKAVPHVMFANLLENSIEPNTLIFRVQPDEGIGLTFQTKKPGTRFCLNPGPVVMNFSFGSVGLDAYEWVLLDCMLGDRMLFLGEEAVEQTWKLLTPLIEKLEATTEVGRFPNYAAGSEGPGEARSLLERGDRAWMPL